VLNGDAVSIIDTWPNMVGIGISVVDTFNSAGHVNIRLRSDRHYADEGAGSSHSLQAASFPLVSVLHTGVNLSLPVLAVAPFSVRRLGE